MAITNSSSCCRRKTGVSMAIRFQGWWIDDDSSGQVVDLCYDQSNAGLLFFFFRSFDWLARSSNTQIDNIKVVFRSDFPSCSHSLSNDLIMTSRSGVGLIMASRRSALLLKEFSRLRVAQGHVTPSMMRAVAHVPMRSPAALMMPQQQVIQASVAMSIYVGKSEVYRALRSA